jgi:regulator of RNase E activity RraA
VQIGGLRISPGDLLHGDRHGILQIPRKIAEEIPGVANKMLANERRIIDACHSRDFSIEKLRGTILEIESSRVAGKPNRTEE